MTEEAREPRAVDAVEVELDGRSCSFDGNDTNDLDTFAVMPRGYTLSPRDLDELVDWVVEGNLAWVIVPVEI